MGMELMLGGGGGTGIAESRASRAAMDAEHLGRRLVDLENRVNRLALTSMALWTLLRERTGLSEEELMELVQEFDLRDGKLDGKMSVGITDCPSCQRPVSQKHRRCLYCDYPLEAVNAFDGVVR